jgi:outer membrane lipoprotein
MKYLMRMSGVALAGSILAGCASQIPKEIRVPPEGNPSVAQVRADAKKYIGAPVRWGGMIANVQNAKSHTLIEVVSRPLDSDGRPKGDSQTEGRFIARFKGFVDPSVYPKDRDLTVAGTIEGEIVRPIGEFPYNFPVVDVQYSYLWAPLPTYRYSYPPPWYYDPWYPYGFYGPWPYRPYPYWW